MPQSPPYEKANSKEWELVRQYLIKHLPKQMGMQLEIVKGRRAILNPQTNETFNICICDRSEDPKNSGYRLAVDGSGRPWMGDQDATWLILFDVKESRFYFISMEQLRTALNSMSESGVFSTVDSWRVYVLHDNVVRSLSKVYSADDETYLRFRAVKTAQSEDFCHLHCHSMYSLLDGVSGIDDIPRRAQENGQPGIALTDHGMMMGTFKFYNLCKKRGVKPLLGVEFYIVHDVNKKYQSADGSERPFEFHQTVLAATQQGWENLCLLNTMACRDYFYGRPRIDKDLLFKYGDGLIVLSGCFKGFVAWHLQQHDPERAKNFPLYLTNPTISRNFMREYRERFGDRYYIEAMGIDYEPYMKIVPQLMGMADEEKIPVVITNDCHYEVAEDSILQSLLFKIAPGSWGDRMDMKETGMLFIKSRDEIDHPLFTPDMFSRTCEIMDRCNVSLDSDGYMFPPYDLKNDPDWKEFQASDQQPVVDNIVGVTK